MTQEPLDKSLEKELTDSIRQAFGERLDHIEMALEEDFEGDRVLAIRMFMKPVKSREDIREIARLDLDLKYKLIKTLWAANVPWQLDTSVNFEEDKQGEAA